MMKHNLVPFFEPRSVAIIGASAVPGKPGHEVIRNILANGYPGKIYPVNPKGGKILGLDVLASISNLPADCDVAVIILPAGATPQALRECADRGIRNFVLSSGGFAEVDAAGAQIQDALVRIIREKGIQVLGPPRPRRPSHPPSFPRGRSAGAASPTSPRREISAPIP
jgi:acyl-CoA synthetase (NDP forming)